MTCTNLISIRIERRRLAVAVFSGLRLEYHDVRELPTDSHKARVATRRFVSWIVATFPPEAVAVETVTAREGTRRTELAHIVGGTLMLLRTPRIHVSSPEVLGGFAAPALRTKKELRAVGAALWPELAARHVHPSTFDAATLGLHVQMRSLFHNP
jgi:hypothetical protein